MTTTRYPPNCVLIQTFEEHPGHLDCFHTAENWLAERGLELGSTQFNRPVVVYRKGQWGGGSSKWTHIEAESMEHMPGYLEGDRKTGPLRLYLVGPAAQELGIRN